MKMQDVKGKFQKNNKGSSIVMVLIMVSFLGILTGMLMLASYGGYKMKLVDKQNKNTFYTVETVLDEINVGLQKTVSVAVAYAYQDVMANFSRYDNSVNRNNAFYEKYYTKLKEELHINAVNSKGNIATLRSYITTDELKGDGDLTLRNFGNFGAIIEGKSSEDEYDIEIDMTKMDELLLKGIKVSYVTPAGAVAMIETNIRIDMPRLNFSDSSAFPALNNYVAITDAECEFKSKGTETKVHGNIYSDQMLIELVAGENEPIVSFFPSVDAKDDEFGSVIVKNDIKLSRGTLNTTNMDLWATNLDLTSSKANLNGNTYLKKDLELNGKDCKLDLAGNYYGYSALEHNSAESSAILINGRDSNVDLTRLNNLVICGRTYIGTKMEDNPLATELEKRNVEDIMMGESIATKSNQLAYLAPPNAICCKYNDDNSIGDSVIGTNPMTKSQYEVIARAIDKEKKEKEKNPDSTYKSPYVLINQDYKVFGENTLRSYTGGVDPTIIFKNTNTEPLVYFYLNFDKSEDANRYFRDYYAANQQKVDKYSKIYAKQIKANGAEQFANLQTEGNILTYNGINETGSVIENKGNNENLIKLGEELNNKYTALTKKLVPNVELLNGTEFKSTVFNNIIDSEKVTEVATTEDMVLSTDDGKKVLITNAAITSVIPDDVQLIISNGAVEINKSFKGLILAKGKVTITSSVNVDLNSLTLDEFTKLLMAKDTEKKFYALDFFKDGINYQHSENKKMDYGTEKVSMADLIVYEDWSKK